jgi:hypothetical protein
MRLGLLPWFWLAACDPADRQARTIVFDAPTPRVVLPGDSIASISREFAASEADVRVWNRLERREARVGEVLHVWRPPRAEPSLALVVRGRPAEPEGARPSRKARAAAKPQAASVGMGLADLRSWMMTPATAAQPLPVDPVALAVEATRVHGAGVLGSAHIETGDLEDLDVAGLTARRTAVGGTSLASRGGGLAERGSAESIGQVAALRAVGAPAQSWVPNTPVRPPALPTPAAKRCLATSTADDLGESGMSGSRGLTTSQVRAALAPFARHTSACIPSGATGTWAASFGIAIGCDGRVSSAWTVESGGLPATVTSCIESTLRHAGFPAHDMPAGVDVTWPITYRR